MEKNGDEAIKYGGEIWVNQGQLEKYIYSNIWQIYLAKVSIILTNFKNEIRSTRVW